VSGREARWSLNEISARRLYIYRPPGPVSSAFTDQLCQLLDQFVLLNTRFVVVGDFNTPGDIAGQIHHHVADVFTQYDLCQHVSVPTHVVSNILDLIVSQDCERSRQLISALAVQSVYFSDHHLVTCRLGVPPTPPVTTTYSYRPLRKMDTTPFCHDMFQSRLFDFSVTDADEYAVRRSASRETTPSHRDCYTTTTGLYTATPGMRSLSLRSASSSWTKST